MFCVAHSMPIVLHLVYVFCWRDVNACLEGVTSLFSWRVPPWREIRRAPVFTSTPPPPCPGLLSCVWRLCLDKRHRGLVHKECCRAPVQLGGGGAWYATEICLPVLLWKWRHLSGDGQSLLLEAWLLWDMLWLGRVCRRPMK